MSCTSTHFRCGLGRRLLSVGRLGPPRQPDAVEIAGVIIVCVIGTLSSAAGLATLSLLLTLTASGDVHQHAAATVFAALFAQQAISPILYDLFGPPSPSSTPCWSDCCEADNQRRDLAGQYYIGPRRSRDRGRRRVLLVSQRSLAALCWVALPKLERPEWRRLESSS